MINFLPVRIHCSAFFPFGSTINTKKIYKKVVTEYEFAHRSNVLIIDAVDHDCRVVKSTSTGAINAYHQRSSKLDSR